jgi:hypothetical protein
MTTKQIEKNFQEIWSLFKETDKKFKETDEELKKTNKVVEETSRTVEETSRTVKETSKTAKEMIKAVDSLTGKWSKFVEGLIAPAAERLFKERGIKVDTIYQRVKRHKNGKEMEVDILAINSEYAVLIEAKSTLKVEDIKEHIERLKKFKIFFPEYSGRKVVGAVGGIVIDEDSDKYAYKSGLFVITESGESVRILNDKKFRPKIW